MNAKWLLSLPQITSQVIYHASTQLSAGVTRTRLKCVVHALLSILHQRTPGLPDEATSVATVGPIPFLCLEITPLAMIGVEPETHLTEIYL